MTNETQDEISLWNEEIPDPGVAKATIENAAVKELTDARGKKFKAIVLALLLAARDTAGNQFKLDKVYRLDRRGKERLAELLASLRGVESLSKEDLAKFKPSELNGKDVQVTITHSTEDGRTIAEAGAVKKIE